MSLQNAFAFLDRLQSDDALRGEAAELAGAIDLLPLTELAARRGLPCDPGALRTAWRKRCMLKEAVAHATGVHMNKPDA